MRRPLLSLVVFVGMLAVAEGALRAAVATGWPRVLADPGRYADPLWDDQYWILRARGGLAPALRRHTEHEQDPLLGWVPDRRNLNPMGGWQSPPFPEGASATVAVFGDSFVFGTVPDGERLPDHLQGLLPGTRVLNYGVAGYGVDQIALRVAERATVLQRARAEVVVGLLTTDLDRALLSVRSGPKPHHTDPGGERLAQSHDAFFATAPGPGSLLWRALRRLTTPVDAHRGRVEAAAAPPLADLDRRLRGGGLVVVFEGPEEVVAPPGWRVDLIREHSSGPVWLAREALGADPLRLYGADRHLNSAGNRAVAEGIAGLLLSPPG